MNTRPRLVPLPPARTGEVLLQASPCWVGAGAGCALRFGIPGLEDRHAVVLEREDGFWLVPVRAVRPAPRVNGRPLAAEIRLRPGDVVELAPGAAFRFAEAERPAAPVPPPRAASPAPPGAPAPRPRRRFRSRGSGVLSPLGWTAVVLAVLLVAGSAALGVRAFRAGPETARPLSEEDAEHFDALTLRAYEHVERGTAMLEMGMGDAALKEFARGVNTLETSRLRADPAVRRSVAALESTIAGVYRRKRIRVPSTYAAAPRRPSAPRPALRGGMSTGEFAERFARVQQRFQERFGRTMVVTGRDHPEHLSLYGPGSALDLRVRDLSREQVAFAVEALLSEGIRVKDFSEDAILQAQIRSARAAGLHDRAGTGLHLHVDRFPNRQDRWTVR